MPHTTFTNPQVVLFCEDVERTAAFYTKLGFTGAFRTPPAGPVRHVDLVLDGHRIGFVSHEAARGDHGIPANREAARGAVILWCDDTPAAYQRLLDAGATPLEGPHPFLDDLLIAWAVDPDGHPIQVVQRLPGRP